MALIAVGGDLEFARALNQMPPTEAALLCPGGFSLA
jgi:hypothetical protein